MIDSNLKYLYIENLIHAGVVQKKGRTMLNIEETEFGKYTKIKILNSETNEFVSIIPENGAIINELNLTKDDVNYSIIDGYSTYEELIKNAGHKSSKMFPFPNRIKDGKYKFNNNEFQLPINHVKENHAIHGFVFNKKFKIVETKIEDHFASVTLKYIYKGEITGYPFEFEITIINSLIDGEGFKCQTDVKNIGKLDMIMGDGWHPYLKFDKKVNDLFLTIPESDRIEVDDRMIPTGNIIDYNDFAVSSKIGDTSFDTGFYIKNQNEICKTEIYNPEADIKLIISQETGGNKYNYLQIYIPPSRDSIAIEPMTCNTNAFNNKQGLITFKPNEQFEAWYGVQLM